jgi:proline iminopeptidase
MSGTGKAAAAALLIAGYAAVVRPRLLRWGATDDEVRLPFPGEHLVPGGRRGATMAVTIDAPPEQVWPWLAQMGTDRGGHRPAARRGDRARPRLGGRLAGRLGAAPSETPQEGR